ncbi:MAG: GNAT family N-acetyltransferase [Gammaproteobacteria bacterium]|nr:GNAT family N-acetyltransferase [Gammaproteobacteria bacterium]
MNNEEYVLPIQQVLNTCFGGCYMDPKNHWLIAMENQEVLGVASISEDNISVKREEYSLWSLCVLPQYRGQGIATQIMTVAFKHFQGDMSLKVEEGNPAASLYYKLGFRVITVEPHVLKPNVLVMFRPVLKASSLVQMDQSPTSAASSLERVDDPRPQSLL